MDSEADICNLALGRIGQKQFISALTDNNVSARRCAQVYPVARDRVLASYLFPWAQTIKLLAASAEVIPGWGQVYDYPAECLRLESVCDEAGARVWSRRSATLDWREPGPSLPEAVFRTFAGEDDTLIATDVPQAYAVYTRRLTDVRRFPPLAKEALAWAVAFDLAIALQVSDDLYQRAEQWAEISLGRAVNHSRNEAEDDPLPDSPSILARG